MSAGRMVHSIHHLDGHDHRAGLLAGGSIMSRHGTRPATTFQNSRGEPTFSGSHVHYITRPDEVERVEAANAIIP
jgi:hypothetical protein